MFSVKFRGNVVIWYASLGFILWHIPVAQVQDKADELCLHSNLLRGRIHNHMKFRTCACCLKPSGWVKVEVGLGWWLSGCNLITGLTICWVASSWWRRCPFCKDWTLRHPHFGHPHFGEHHFLGILTLGNTRWENRIVDLRHTDRSYCHLSFLKPTHSSYSKPISTKNTCLQNIFCLSFLGRKNKQEPPF